MAHNINLYSRARKSRAEMFSARGVVLIALALLLGFGLLGLSEIRHTATLRNQIASDKAESERLARALKQLPTETNQSDQLTAEERDIKALEAVAARLTAGVLGRAGSFTETLKGLGRATHEGVWLTGIKLHQASGRLTLEGKALDAARVPALMGALGEQPEFAGTAFAALDIKREEGASSSGRAGDAWVQFRITSLEAQALSLLGTTAQAAVRPTSATAQAQAHITRKAGGSAP